MDRSTSDDDEEEADEYQHKGMRMDDLGDDWVEAQMKDVTVAATWTKLPFAACARPTA